MSLNVSLGQWKQISRVLSEAHVIDIFACKTAGWECIGHIEESFSMWNVSSDEQKIFYLS